MQSPDNLTVPLIDSTLSAITFELGERACVREITVQIPTMAQLLAVIRIEPKDLNAETVSESIERSYRGALIFCLPPEPVRWSLNWFAWRLQRRRISRAIRSLSYPQLMTMMRNMEAWAMGMSHEALSSINRPPTEKEISRDKVTEAIHEMVQLVAGETGMAVSELWAMPGPELAAQFKAVVAKLQRDAQRASAASVQMPGV